MKGKNFCKALLKISLKVLSGLGILFCLILEASAKASEEQARKQAEGRHSLQLDSFDSVAHHIATGQIK